MVGGTGLGGFYAILFSLHMTISQVIASHKIIQNVLFSSVEWERNDALGCATMLRTALTRIAKEVGLDFDLDSPFLSKNSLKCFVCVLNDLNAGRARAIRNYRIRSSKSPHCSIREAIHATLSDGVHLPSVYIQDEQFVAAASGFANPSYELMKELPAVFLIGSKLSCFVNLGACHPGILPITSGGSEEERANLLRYADVVAQNLVSLCGGLGPCYFRLSVVMGAKGSTQWSPDDAFRAVKSATVGYLEEEKVQMDLDAVVAALTQSHGVVSLERLASLAAEDGKARLNTQVEVIHDHIVRIARVMDHGFYHSMKAWLTPIDQTTKLDACIRARSSSTCGWLWDHPQVIEWKATGGIFWCHAGMGAGKTIIASHIIETLKNLPDECIVAYFYFEFTNPSTLSEEALFRSIVSQLSHTSESISRQLYEQHTNGLLQPQLKSLHKALHDLAITATRPVYIIVDALDELPLPRRRYLLESLLELSSLAQDSAHVMVTSRDEVDINEIFSGKVSLDFSIEKEMVQHDIATFVDQQLAAKKWQSWPKQEVLHVRNILISQADGMFRMVACQIEVLNQTQSTEEMRQALASLPATLADTYRYVLNTIPSHLRTRAHTLLCIISAALKPVSIAELSELLAVELGDSTDSVNLPVYHEGLRYHEPQNIIGLGTALIRQIGSWDNHVVLQLSHASVKEYLLQDTCSWYALNDQLAHETTARACLALLNYNEDPSHTSKIEDIHYTKSDWWRHIHPNHSAQLLSQQKQLFETFPWVHSNVGASLVKHMSAASFFKSPLLTDQLNYLKSPLLIALGARLEQLFYTILEYPSWLISPYLNDALTVAAQEKSPPEMYTALIEKGGDVNTTTPGGAPLLHREAHSGRLDIVQVLIKYGADVNSWEETYGSALLASVNQGSLDIVKFLVKSGAEVNMARGSFGSALQAAANQGSLDIVKFLVESGVDVNLVKGSSGSALQAAAVRGALDIVQFLVEKGADVNVVGRSQGSALQLAATCGALDVTQLLVEKGADVNMLGGEQGSALQEAAARGLLDMVVFLVEEGADVNVMGGNQGSALQLAASCGSLNVVQFLVEEGADVNLVGGGHGSALQIAATCDALDMVEFLVEKGADVNRVSGYFGSALQAAAVRGSLDVIKFLVDKGADMNMAGGHYGSALELAEFMFKFYDSSQRRQEVIDFLIANGAVRSSGPTPLVGEYID
ncbi:ankyrin repeat-containing domain protein [Flagelloscypha sp. PMI_526]|nr:ankyrin repeat-containing domain protein [Flagelloscypha sp. PMI_526]